ncbi:LutB/LldF family L-lactate oxidation iron-sulfur protein [Coralloluteibacterium stylophorae]|uniref:Iron-sulfur cluster-binding protein n=1 Tax=Coralloluteibacterium stylophorae TaxID=1776034 RepID=A0A8J8AZT1_9GAMM|nr:LutB/LldF family L-lactate oxidation iron-sulfur protein [Coralloluteibacterium stylophorae]MBS7458883.1 iron-sulfur cluster-binding protein [Coralloluteibacterium stylophorae]
MTDTLPLADPAAFHRNARRAVADPHLRGSFRGAMDFLMDKRAAQFPERAGFEALRDLGRAIRQHALANLPALLERLEERLAANGVQVHWAEDAADANRIFAAIAERHAAATMVKGKSMVSEEIELNHRMAERGVECVETDMGEYILQLDGDRPSHIIMPAIHKTKEDVAAIFDTHLPGAGYTEDVDELIAIGRRSLRSRFKDARIGVSGVNFLVAETGSLVLVENEGNGRMATSVPDVHVAITGIEKVIEKLEHVAPLYTLLTRSATGQAVTTYLNVITGPRRTGERDGPRELHLVLLDNGRTQAYREARFRETLQCIRCGACMNHCPVYARVGGLSYGTTYPGPIGSIISPHLMGLDATRHLPTASSLCGACGEVCPVGIPIPELLTRLREAGRHDRPAPGQDAPLAGQGSVASWRERMTWKAWRTLNVHPRLYRAFVRLASTFRALAPPRQAGWTRSRVPIRPAARPLRERLRARAEARVDSARTRAG